MALITTSVHALSLVAPTSSAPSCLFLPNLDLRCSSNEALCRDIQTVQCTNTTCCCQSCSSDSQCAAAVLEPWSSNCYLKAMAVGANLTTRREGVVGCIARPGKPLPPSPNPSPPSPSPTPYFPFRNTSLPLEERVKDLIGRLTLDEKVLQMTRGGAASNCPAPEIQRLGIAPHVWGTECNSGLGSDDGSFAGTSFPQPLGLAASWDRDLVRAVATVFHVELRAQHNEDMRNGLVKYHHGINCWSPVVNIMRHWAWGRNDETYGECPVLSSAFASEFVHGLQGDDPRYVAATAGCKHFVVHGGPDATRQTFSANVTLRDWATTFLPAFETCVQAGGLGMMCSFNAIRGVPACANHRSMTTWARSQWNFSGYMVSDQGAVYGIMADHKYADTLPQAAAFAVRAGLDLEDANDESHTAFSAIPQAIEKGFLSEDDINIAVSRLFRVRFQTGEFDPVDENPYRSITVDQIRSAEHLELSKTAAQKSFVLLKNDNNTLPLRKNRQYRPSLVGPFGSCQSCYFGKYSPHKDDDVTVTIEKGLQQVGYPVSLGDGCSGDYKCKSYNKSQVVSAVSSSNLCIIAVGLGSGSETEGMDRANLDLPGFQNDLVADAIQAARIQDIPVVVLLFVAGPVDPAIFDNADAVIDCIYPAETTGIAIANTLVGAVSPAGRLPFSWPTSATDVPPEADYTMQGRTYRYEQRNVKFPFGFGLSYSDFDYELLNQQAPGRNIIAYACDAVNVTVKIKNTGSFDAEEVAQLYVEWNSVTPPVLTPSLSLADFQRVYIRAGDSEIVTLQLHPRYMAVLSNPVCGIVPQAENTRLAGSPIRNESGVGSADQCCMMCGSLEQCEAFSYDTMGKTCELHSAWGLTVADSGFASGEPLSQWVLRPSTISLTVGGSSSKASRLFVRNVTLSGPEVPLSSCKAF